MSVPVAVIDIGSNSIKVLVAERTAGGPLAARFIRTLDARISAGISRARPLLSDDGIARGVAAVRELAADARREGASRILAVATSAVRDALNGRDFCARIENDAGCRVRILTGEEEANLIGRGLRCDPALAGLSDFSVFDLGGGSLECLAFQGGKVVQAVSLSLGCVRLTERCVSDPTAPFTDEARHRVTELTKEVVAKSGFHAVLPADRVAIGTGGTLTTARAILAARHGRTLEQTDTLLPVPLLQEMLAWIGREPLPARKQVPGLPPARADIFPTALATFLALAECTGIGAYRNSLYNLRWGVADEALA